MTEIPSHQDAEKREAFFKELAQHCDSYKTPDLRKSILQMSTTLALFFAGIAAMIFAVQSGAWLAYALLLLPVSGLLVRVFIVQHDCGHESYFASSKANKAVGLALSILTWTPFDFWRRTHNMHHASSGNLDKRGYGGIETITVKEFNALPAAKQRFYRIYRNTLFMLGFGTPFWIIVLQRFIVTEPFMPELGRKVNFKNAPRSIHGLNLMLFLTYVPLGFLIGFGTLAIVYLPVLTVTSWIGGWLFYIQHQFEETLWDKQENWSYNEAAVMSSSYYDLPPILQWFTGNIGLHHIHHLNAAIPNYRLQECLDAHPALPTLNRMTLKDSLKSVHLALWDEDQRKMISFKDLPAAA